MVRTPTGIWLAKRTIIGRSLRLKGLLSPQKQKKHPTIRLKGICKGNLENGAVLDFHCNFNDIEGHGLKGLLSPWKEQTLADNYS